MNTIAYGKHLRILAGLIASCIVLASCASNAPSCAGPQSKNLDSAISTATFNQMLVCSIRPIKVRNNRQSQPILPTLPTAAIGLFCDL